MARLCAPNAGPLGSIPGQGTNFYMPQLRVHMLKLKIPHATTKTRYTQINKYFQASIKKRKPLPTQSSSEHTVLRALANYGPLAWQSNKAVLFYFTQNSISQIQFQCWGKEAG